MSDVIVSICSFDSNLWTNATERKSLNFRNGSESSSVAILELSEDFDYSRSTLVMTSRVGFKRCDSKCVDCLSKTNGFLDVIDPILASVSRYDERTQPRYWLIQQEYHFSLSHTGWNAFWTIDSRRRTHFTLTCVSSSFVLLLTIYGFHSDNLCLFGNFMWSQSSSDLHSRSLVLSLFLGPRCQA